MLLFYVGFVGYNNVLLLCFSVLIYFRTVYDICFIVLFCSLVVVYYFSCASLDILVFGYYVGILAVFYVFCIFFMVSRALVSSIYLASISSAFSIVSSSSCGSTSYCSGLCHSFVFI
jgi:hypothetical protein